MIETMILTEEPLLRDDDERYEAVRRRDAREDGRFVYAVATTGVYCRPSCSARPALRRNVSFHPNGEAAERAGFRPCKRCRPDGPSAAERRAVAIAAACRAIEGAESVPSLRELADAARMSPSHFHRRFRAATGLTPRDYGAAVRARRLRERLRDSPSVTQALYDAGFGSSSRFYESAEAALGMKPSVYRRGAPDTRIGYAIEATSLGPLLVAGTERGICAVAFGESAEALAGELRAAFPRASLVAGEERLSAWVAVVVAGIEGSPLATELPLDVRGTAFQHRVWRALREIPSGTTTSYATLAARLGNARGARAVARACASNPAAVVVPCHRVVRADGAIAGYRWGIERKRELLRREAEAKP